MGCSFCFTSVSRRRPQGQQKEAEWGKGGRKEKATRWPITFFFQKENFCFSPLLWADPEPRRPPFSHQYFQATRRGCQQTTRWTNGRCAESFVCRPRVRCRRPSLWPLSPFVKKKGSCPLDGGRVPFSVFFVIFCVGLLAAPRNRQRRCHAAFAAWTWAERKKRSAPTAAIETGSDDQKKIV